METTGSSTDRTPTGSGRGVRARAGLAGAVLGVGAAVGALVLVSAGAGAQPAVQTVAPSGVGVASEAVADDAGTVADDLGIDGEAFEAHWACVEEIFAPVDESDDELELTDEQWEAIEGDLEACDELLPEGYLEELEAAEAAFDQCLTDQGIDLGEFDGDELDETDGEDGEWEEADEAAFDEAAGIVFVETDDGETIASFGEGDGSVTITKGDDGIVVASEGDVTTETIDWDELDGWDEEWAELDAAFAVCEDEVELPFELDDEADEIEEGDLD